MDTEEYFEKYGKFVDFVTSEGGKSDKEFAKNFAELSKLLNGNFSRFDHAVTGLTGEAGEVADIWKKIKFMGLEYNEQTKEKIIKELGDICWYLMTAALALNIPFEEIIDKNIAKLEQRHPHGYSAVYLQRKKGDND